MDISTSWPTGYLSTIVFIFKKNQLKREKCGKSSEPWSHITEPCLDILGLAGASSFLSCFLCRKLPRHFKVSVRSRIIIAKYMLQSCYRLSSFIFVFVVQCCSGWVWGNGWRSNEIAKRLTSSFFAMPELVSVIAEQRVAFFQYFSLTLELCPQLTKWYVLLLQLQLSSY